MHQVFHSVRLQVSIPRNFEDYWRLTHAPCNLVNFFNIPDEYPSSITVHPDKRGRVFFETSLHNCQTAPHQIPPPPKKNNVQSLSSFPLSWNYIRPIIRISYLCSPINRCDCVFILSSVPALQNALLEWCFVSHLYGYKDCIFWYVKQCVLVER